MASPISPSVYVARLRRAFLLCAHPDRFRSHPHNIRRQQASLIQAISERMASPDFLAFTAGESTHSPYSLPKKNKENAVLYVLQEKDGTLVNQSIQLDDTVEGVLKSMRDALQTVGTVNLPPPPAAPSPPKLDPTRADFVDEQTSESYKNEFYRMHGIVWASSQRGGADGAHQVDRRFDVNSYRGRDLKGFLKTLDPQQVEERRSSRMDASAAALVVRRAFQFQAVDGTRMGWSSASLARCLMSLMALHEEHHTKFRVSSFYPLRLVISSDEFLESLDVYGGILRLNPAATPLQWLETLREVTEDKLEEYRSNQKKVQEYNRIAQGALGVKIKKGFSCSSSEYHMFLAMLAAAVKSRTDQEGLAVTSNALMLERVLVTVESSHQCRRGLVNRDGSIRVGAGMLGENILGAISRLSIDARKRVLEERENRQRCKEAIDRAQWEFGLNRVYRAGMVAVTTEELMDCLSRLLAADEKDRSQIKYHLAGNSLGVAGSGQRCHLDDDGSVVIPWDWR